MRPAENASSPEENGRPKALGVRLWAVENETLSRFVPVGWDQTAERAPAHHPAPMVGRRSPDQERFRRRQQVEIPGHKVFVPTAEDIIITKLRWSTHGQRSKYVDDARGIIAVQGDRLDLNYIRAWCECHGTSALFDEIRRSIPSV